MYCIECGSKMPGEASFCIECGTQVVTVEQEETAAAGVSPVAAPVYEQVVQQEQAAPRKMSPLMWILPSTSLVAGLAIIGVTLVYQAGVNSEVEETRLLAEEYALDGDYAKAELLLEDALEKRPNHRTIQMDLKWLQQAKEVDQHLADAKTQIAGQQYEQALATLKEAEQKASFGGTLGKSLMLEIEAEKIGATVAGVDDSLQTPAGGDFPLPEVPAGDGVQIPDVSGITDDVSQALVDATIAEATSLMEQGRYDEALDALDATLYYEPDNRELLALWDQIMAEQGYGPQGVDIASGEQPLEVLSSEVTFVGYGGFEIKGTVQNISDRTVEGIFLYFTLANDDGSFSEEMSTYVDPYALQPGETGTFEYFYYAEDQTKLNITVTESEWYEY